MKRYTLYLGLNDKDSKVQQVSTVEAYKIVKGIFTRNFDGATIFEAQGIYKHEDGTIVTENTLRIEVLEFDTSIYETVKDVVKTLKTVFNQESVAVQIEVCNSELW